MAFYIEEPETFGIRSEVKQPLDFAQTKKHTVKYRLKKLKNKDWKELIDAGKSVGEIIEETLVDFEGCNVKAGEFSEDDKASLLEYNWLVDDIWQAQVAIQNGKTYGMRLGN